MYGEQCFLVNIGGQDMEKNQIVNLTRDGVTRINILTGFNKKVNCQIDFYAVAFDAMEKGRVLEKQLLQENKEKKKITVELEKIGLEVQRIIFIDEIYAVDSASKAEPPYFKAVSNEKTWQFDVDHEMGWHCVIIGFELYRYNNEWWLRAVGNSVSHRIFSLMKTEYNN